MAHIRTGIALTMGVDVQAVRDRIAAAHKRFQNIRVTVSEIDALERSGLRINSVWLQPSIVTGGPSVSYGEEVWTLAFSQDLMAPMFVPEKKEVGPSAGADWPKMMGNGIAYPGTYPTLTEVTVSSPKSGSPATAALIGQTLVRFQDVPGTVATYLMDHWVSHPGKFGLLSAEGKENAFALSVFKSGRRVGVTVSMIADDCLHERSEMLYFDCYSITGELWGPTGVQLDSLLIALVADYRKEVSP